MTPLRYSTQSAKLRNRVRFSAVSHVVCKILCIFADMKKKCVVCKKTKPLSEFRKNCSRKDGYHSCCSLCDKKRQKEWYKKNKERLSEKVKKRNRITRNTCRQYAVGFLKEHPCCCCGESDIVVLDFDHINGGEKENNISKLIIAGNLSKLKEEILKCQILCANCHRRKTAADYNWTKLLMKD